MATRLSPARCCHRGLRAAAAEACRQASDTATMALARCGTCPSCRPARSAAVHRCWSRASTPSRAERIAVFTLRTAMAASRLLASPAPVEAPAGAMARPRAPLRWTSASTVARPRESQTRRATTSTILAMLGAPRRDAMGERRAARALRDAPAPSAFPASGIRRATCRPLSPAASRAAASRLALRGRPARTPRGRRRRAHRSTQASSPGRPAPSST